MRVAEGSGSKVLLDACAGLMTPFWYDYLPEIIEQIKYTD